MKRILLAGIALCFMSISFAQMQIGNSNFETWENVSSGQEPTNWNSFITASGGWAWAAQSQIQSSTDVRPGSTGTKSCRINARSAFSIIANGNVTLGQVNMGSTEPTDASNHNISRTADASFSEVMTDSPDSLIFWAKYNGTSEARVKATIHDEYDYKDPEDATSTSHVVATAVLNYASAGGGWIRHAVPFVYSGPATTPAFILMTFTTNMLPGGGSATDVVLIDDVSLTYPSPSASTSNLEANNDIQFNMIGNSIVFTSKGELNGEYRVFDLVGQLIQKGRVTNQVTFDQKSGVYLVTIESSKGRVTKRVYKN